MCVLCAYVYNAHMLCYAKYLHIWNWPQCLRIDKIVSWHHNYDNNMWLQFKHMQHVLTYAKVTYTEYGRISIIINSHVIPSVTFHKVRMQIQCNIHFV